MAQRQVIVQGGGANVYEVAESSGIFTAYHVRVRLLGNDRTRIGSGRSLEDAISLIKVHSGRQIKSIN